MLVYSDTIHYQGIIQDIDYLLWGDGKTFNPSYSLEDRTRNINGRYDEITSLLFRADPRWKWDDSNYENLPIGTTELKANQENYAFGDPLLVISKLRVKDRNGDYITLTPRAREELPDSILNGHGDPQYYYKIGNAVFPVPIPDYGMDEGFEITFQRMANYFVSTDTDKMPGFAPNFHRYLSIGAALDHAIANGMTEKINVLTAMLEVKKKEIDEHYNRRSADERPKLTLKRQSVRHFGL
jgi:hypothetical protein